MGSEENSFTGVNILKWTRIEIEKKERRLPLVHAADAISAVEIIFSLCKLFV